MRRTSSAAITIEYNGIRYADQIGEIKERISTVLGRRGETGGREDSEGEGRMGQMNNRQDNRNNSQTEQDRIGQFKIEQSRTE